MRELVIGDSHGNFDLVERTLFRHDADMNFHVGDLIDGGMYASPSADLKCLELLENGRLDALVVGNHEYAFLSGPTFGGMRPDREISERLRNLIGQGKLIPALLIGDFLVTHAGVHPRVKRSLLGKGRATAEQLHDAIWDRWAENPYDDIFGNVGSERGGTDTFGGIIWRDVSENIYPINQVFGHSYDHGEILRQHNNVTYANVDVGAKGAQGGSGAILFADGQVIDTAIIRRFEVA